MSLLPVEAALEKIYARIPAPSPESVALRGAEGRVLFQPLIAAHNQPPFNASAMDGYAVQTAFLEGSDSATLTGFSKAGEAFSGRMEPHQTVRIFTGAPVPEGADAVIMQEEASVLADRVSFSSKPKPGDFIRPVGNDFRDRQVLLPAGARLTPYSLTLAAAANQPLLTVSRRPTVSILATGDELVLPGAKLGPSQIVSANNFGLEALLKPHAESVTDLGIADDNAANLERTLRNAFAAGTDILVTSGGASVGDHDIVQDVLKSLNVEMDFWRINLRPGKPLMFGTLGRTLIFGLPGNPVSALVTATLFLLPTLRRWVGADPTGPRLRLPLAAELPANGSRRHFQRATLETSAAGTFVRPITETDSGHTFSLGQAQALIIQPENAPLQQAGTLIDVIPLV
ncbi:MAG TPA: gephyrin-like molybdotransferase Glp [Devosiaceae bacterium]|jgi:molybdopterin molybdotransferase